MNEASALLRDIADGRAIDRDRAVGFAEAVLEADEVSATALRVRGAKDEHLLRRTIELAGLVLQKAVRAKEDAEGTGS